ncbi:YadA-like family protein (plasmid) [Enterobacter asburiae]|uniref:YadA C-terminal domain-containing protein n=1 Tax=Enterobacter asburiae TaxID=61645 RepID=UPI00197DC2B4|nr:YadA-like family protein [Enterobacter asburiae]MBN4806909.1 YadA-like family protein [Enterobacter asburiae]
MNIAIGSNAKIGGGGGANIAIGNNATVDNVAAATAIGNRATVTAVNSVAVGYGSVADRIGTVSVGGNGTERQITNVEAGTVGTDAVNVNQLNDKAAETLKSANEYSTQQITQNRVDSESRDTLLGDRITNVDADLQSAKLGAIVINDKADAALAGLNGKVDQATYDAGQQAQDDHITAVEGAAQTANDRATNLETRADSSEQAIRDTQNAAQTANDRATNLETRADTSEQNIRDVQGAAQIANDRASSLETRADGVEAVNAQQDSTLADHDTRITSNTSALTTKVDKQVFADDQARQDAALKSETTTRTSQVAKLQSGVDQAQATGDYANSRIDVANQNIEANRQASIATNKRVAANTAQLANHEQRITTLEQNTSARFSDLNSKIDDNRKRASAGIAGVAAMANIPQVLEHQTFAIGAGAGNTDGESALAVGFSARASQNTVVKASVSNDTQHNFVVGAGVAFGW